MKEKSDKKRLEMIKKINYITLIRKRKHHIWHSKEIVSKLFRTGHWLSIFVLNNYLAYLSRMFKVSSLFYH